MAVDPVSLVLGPALLLWLAPDGRCYAGEGQTMAEAMKDAGRRWRAFSRPLAVDGHEYHRRQLAR